MLVDGFLAGFWSVHEERGRAALVVEPFESLSDEDRIALAEEGSRLLPFVAGDVETEGVEFSDLT